MLQITFGTMRSSKLIWLERQRFTAVCKNGEECIDEAQFSIKSYGKSEQAVLHGNERTSFYRHQCILQGRLSLYTLSQEGLNGLFWVLTQAFGPMHFCKANNA